MLMLTDVEKLTQLIYKRNDRELLKWLLDNDVSEFEILKPDKNDRSIVFLHEDILYNITAGSDDLPDWIENFIVIPCRELYHGFKGYAEPAKIIADYIKNCPLECEHIVIAGHSRGGAIAQNVFRQIRHLYYKNINGWSFGNPGGGSKKFARGTEHFQFINFDIKGDVVTKLNFLKCDLGKTINLPRQIKGFGNRIRRILKGELNHRSYACIAEIEPWNMMKAKGGYNE